MSRLLCLVLLLVGCSKSKTEPTPVSKAQITQFQAVTITGLTAQQQAGFVKLTNDEICPCSSCNQSFAACLQDQKTCKPAVLLAQWIIDRLKENVPLEMMASALSQEINSGFSSRPQIIDLEGYNSKGLTSAPFTLVEFADFECLHCKQTAKSIDEFLKKHPKEVRLVYKHFPLEGHKMAKEASIAAEAAALQDKFWPMHKALFETEQPLSTGQIEVLAKKIQLDLPRFKRDLGNSSVVDKVGNSLQEGQLLGISGTPALFFNGRPYYLSTDMLGLELRLAMEQARSESTCN